jgi:hypothetical protein
MFHSHKFLTLALATTATEGSYGKTCCIRLIARSPFRTLQIHQLQIHQQLRIQIRMTMTCVQPLSLRDSKWSLSVGDSARDGMQLDQLMPTSLTLLLVSGNLQLNMPNMLLYAKTFPPPPFVAGEVT